VVTAAADPELDPFALLYHDQDIKFHGSVVTAAADPELDPFALLYYDQDIKFHILFLIKSLKFYGIFSIFCRIFFKSF
jgi:hypothetical protein